MRKRRYLAHVVVRSRLSFKRWRRRALFIAGGVLVGAAAVTMAFLADHAQAVFKMVLDVSPSASLFVTPLGFGLVLFLARTVFPNAQGSGIPQVVAALHMAEPERRQPLVSLRVAFGKIILMSLGLLFGASTGREGPTVQVGAALMYAVGRFSPFRRAGFLLAGAAAGVAAAFNTPLAGIVFGIEEMSRSFEVRTSGLIIGAVIAAGLTSLAIVGDYSYFGSTAATLPLGRAWLVVPVCAVAGGLGGGLFGRIVVLFSRGLPGITGRSIGSHPILFAIACGLGVALCAVAGHSPIFGTGYEEAKTILHGGGAEDRWFGPLKFLATVFSAVSGIPGGIFAPSLAIGAGLGDDLTALFHGVPVGALVLLGMVSYLTGVVQAPITSFVIVAEMTDDHAMILPLMGAAIVANGVSKLVNPHGLYHALAAIFLRQEPKAALSSHGNPNRRP